MNTCRAAEQLHSYLVAADVAPSLCLPCPSEAPLHSDGCCCWWRLAIAAEWLSKLHWSNQASLERVEGVEGLAGKEKNPGNNFGIGLLVRVICVSAARTAHLPRPRAIFRCGRRPWGCCSATCFRTLRPTRHKGRSNFTNSLMATGQSCFLTQEVSTAIHHCHVAAQNTDSYSAACFDLTSDFVSWLLKVH